MFGFKKRQSKADAAVAVLDDAIHLAAERWQFFCDKLAFRESVGLADRITAFMVPFAEGAGKTFPALQNAPEGVILMIVAKGVERSGTHSRAEIERALGLPLPDYQRPNP
jgi:hypothetical protein